MGFFNKMAAKIQTGMNGAISQPLPHACDAVHPHLWSGRWPSPSVWHIMSGKCLQVGTQAKHTEAGISRVMDRAVPGDSSSNSSMGGLTRHFHRSSHSRTMELRRQVHYKPRYPRAVAALQYIVRMRKHLPLVLYFLPNLQPAHACELMII